MSELTLTSKAHRVIARLNQLEASTHSRAMFRASSKEDPVQTKEILSEASALLATMAKAINLFENEPENLDISADNDNFYRIYEKTRGGSDVKSTERNLLDVISGMRVGSIKRVGELTEIRQIFVVKVNRSGTQEERFRFVGSHKEALTVKMLHNV